MENGGCETAVPFEIVTMINRAGIVYLGGASPRHLHTAETIFFPGYGYAKTDVTCAGSGARGLGGGYELVDSACICRFQRAPLIERTHAATLSCALGEQCRGKIHKSAIKYSSKPS